MFWAMWLLLGGLVGGLLVWVAGKLRSRHRITMLRRRMEALAAERELERDPERERELTNV